MGSLRSDPGKSRIVRRPYRLKVNGGGNPRKANQEKGDGYLIERCFLRTEGLATSWEQKGFASEKEYFLRDEKGRLFMDYILPRFISEEVPDFEDIKD
jgi:hypothetical protein